MANRNGFDANEVQPVSFDPLPERSYLAAITDSEMKPTKDGSGQFLNLKFLVLDGQYKGRTLFCNLNLSNQNEQTVRISQGQLSAICRAVKIMTPKDSIELHNLPMTIKVKCSRRKDNGELANQISGFYPKDHAAAKPTNSAPAASTGGGKAHR